MRRLESLLVGMAFVVLFLIYVNEGGPGPRQVAALVLLLILVSHVMIESPRWQLGPVYVASTVAILVAGFRLGLSGWVSHLVFWGGGLGLFLGIILGIGLPILRAHQLSGPHFVGTSVFHLAQLDRPEMHSRSAQDARQLMLQVWYPAVETLHPSADYLPDHSVGSRALTGIFNMPWFGLNHLDLIQPNARMDPDLAESDEPFPVLLFSHGRSGTRIQNTFQVEELVSHGYVVAAVDHPFGAGYTVYPDGKTVPYDISIFGDDSPEQAGLVIDEWVKDFSCVLETLEDFNGEEDGQFAGRLDLERIGIFGHSAGGGAAFEFCFQDERCGPVLSYDPWVVPTSDEAIGSGLDEPIMVLKQDVPLGPMSDARLGKLLSNTESPSYVYEIEGAKHLDFNDFKLLVPALEWIGMTGSIDGERLREILNQYTRAFFDTHLRGHPVPPLLDGSASFPEARLRPD